MNEPKVIGLAGVGLQVPDVTVAERFYGAFGLAAERRGAAFGFRSAARPTGGADDIVVLPGSAQKRMHHISFTIRPGDEDAFQEKLRKSGMETHPAPDGAQRSAFGFKIRGELGLISIPEFPRTRVKLKELMQGERRTIALM